MTLSHKEHRSKEIEIMKRPTVEKYNNLNLKFTKDQE